jgi:hypothetical protein
MNSRAFWIMTTAAFVLTWFVFIPYLASNPHIDLTETMAESGAKDRFTGSRGLTMTTDQANEGCMIAVYIAASKVAANHPSAPTDSPDMIYMRCMMNAGVLI